MSQVVGSETSPAIERMPSEIWAEVARSLQPLDIPNLGKVSRSFRDKAHDNRVIWVDAIQRMCREKQFFLGSYPLADMDLDALKNAVFTKYRIRANLKALPDPTARLSAESSVKLDGTVDRYFLVPGGRFLFTLDTARLVLWDLGVPGDPNGASIRRVADQILPAFDRREQHIGAVDLGGGLLQVAVALGQHTCPKDLTTLCLVSIYRISPCAANPTFEAVPNGMARFSHEGVKRRFCEDIVMQGSRVFIRFGVAWPSYDDIVMWDFARRRCWSRVIPTSHPETYEFTVAFTETLVIAFFRTNVSIWKLPSIEDASTIVSPSSVVNIPTSTEAWNTLSKEPYLQVHFRSPSRQSDSVVSFVLPSPWSSLARLPLVFDMTSLPSQMEIRAEKGTVRRYELRIPDEPSEDDTSLPPPHRRALSLVAVGFFPTKKEGDDSDGEEALPSVVDYIKRPSVWTGGLGSGPFPELRRSSTPLVRVRPESAPPSIPYSILGYKLHVRPDHWAAARKRAEEGWGDLALGDTIEDGLVASVSSWVVLDQRRKIGPSQPASPTATTAVAAPAEFVQGSATDAIQTALDSLNKIQDYKFEAQSVPAQHTQHAVEPTTAQAPAPVIATAQAPATVVTAAQAPAPIVATAQASAPVVTTAQAASAVVATTQAPAPVVVNTQAPAPVVATNQAAAPAVTTRRGPGRPPAGSGTSGVYRPNWNAKTARAFCGVDWASKHKYGLTSAFDAYWNALSAAEKAEWQVKLANHQAQIGALLTSNTAAPSASGSA